MSEVKETPPRPMSSPKGWFDLWESFSHFGGMAIGTGWGRIGYHELYKGTLRRSSHWAELGEDSTLPAESEMLARIFVYPVAVAFASAVRAGKIRTASAQRGGGELTPIPRAWWQTDDPMMRFRSCTIDPANPFSGADDLPCWILVCGDDILEVGRLLAEWHSSLPHLNDLARLPDHAAGGVNCIADLTAIRAWSQGAALWFTAPTLPGFGEKPIMIAPTPANDQASKLGVLSQPNIIRPKFGQDRRGAKSGPKPKAWAAHLADMFKRHHDRLVDLSERQRHDFVIKHCTPITGSPDSPRTTARHWDAHLERRARSEP